MKLTRKNKLFLNSASSLTFQVVSVICGFILPRLILGSYGSEVNGLVNSISQFLSFITLMDLGVGTVVAASLYKPLAEYDHENVSRVFVSAKNFFRKIALIYLVYLSGVLIIYPLTIGSDFDYWYTAVLILAISVTYFAQYYFGVVYSLLLEADQRTYVPRILQTVTLIINTVVCALLIHFGASIQVVKLSTSLIFLLRPAVLSIYVRRRYRIDPHIRLTSEPIKQKWNGMAQNVAYYVMNNTDTVVLSIFSTLTNVSIYGVYHLVVKGLTTLCTAAVEGVQALLGNMLARNEQDALNRTFDRLEWTVHTLVTFVFTMCGVLIVPFVQVYTAGVHDTDYTVPLFGVLITLAQAAFCLRLPYNMMVFAAGHFRQTQMSAIIEMMMNIVVSVALVIRFGLIGVAIGTVLAMSYRTVYFAWYLTKEVLRRPIRHFVRHLLVDAVSVGAMLAATFWIHISEITYKGWILMALKVGVICGAICLALNIVFYRQQTLGLLRRFRRRAK